MFPSRAHFETAPSTHTSVPMQAVPTNVTSFELVFETKLDLKGGDLASVSDCRRSRSVRGESGATTLMRPSLRSSPSSMCASGARAGLRAARLHLFLCVALRHSVADARLGEDVLRAAGLLARALLSDDFVYLAERARRIRGVLGPLEHVGNRLTIFLSYLDNRNITMERLVRDELPDSWQTV